VGLMVMVKVMVMVAPFFWKTAGGADSAAGTVGARSAALL